MPCVLSQQKDFICVITEMRPCSTGIGSHLKKHAKVQLPAQGYCSRQAGQQNHLCFVIGALCCQRLCSRSSCQAHSSSNGSCYGRKLGRRCWGYLLSLLLLLLILLLL